MKNTSIIIPLLMFMVLVACNSADKKTDITYQVTISGEGSLQKVTIIPAGLTVSNDSIVAETDPVKRSEVSDLDNDGFPEILIFTQSAGTGSYGNVVGYSPNKGKTLSSIYFPEMDMNSTAAKGYQGHDTFAIVANSLVRKFPLFEADSSSSKPALTFREIYYKLINGEASKKFVIDRVVDLP